MRTEKLKVGKLYTVHFIFDAYQVLNTDNDLNYSRRAIVPGDSIVLLLKINGTARCTVLHGDAMVHVEHLHLGEIE